MGKRWFDRLEKTLGWIVIPQIAILLVTLQVLGFGFILMEGAWVERLALLPQEVLLRNEWWRVITVLALPITQSPIWMIFAMWFLYFILQTLESEWGAFRTTLYVLMSWLATVAYSLLTGMPVLEIRHLETSLFLAAALLFPRFEISLFFIMPVQMKWLAVFSGLFVLVDLFRASWLERGLILCLYSNFMIFFGPKLWEVTWAAYRRWNYRRKH